MSNPYDLMEAATEASRVMKEAWPTVDERELYTRLREDGAYTGTPIIVPAIQKLARSAMMREAQLCEALNVLIAAAVTNAVETV